MVTDITVNCRKFLVGYNTHLRISMGRLGTSGMVQPSDGRENAVNINCLPGGYYEISDFSKWPSIVKLYDRCFEVDEEPPDEDEGYSLKDLYRSLTQQLIPNKNIPSDRRKLMEKIVKAHGEWKENFGELEKVIVENYFGDRFTDRQVWPNREKIFKQEDLAKCEENRKICKNIIPLVQKFRNLAGGWELEREELDMLKQMENIHVFGVLKKKRKHRLRKYVSYFGTLKLFSNVADGRGIEFDPAGHVTFCGRFKNGHKHGNGVMWLWKKDLCVDYFHGKWRIGRIYGPTKRELIQVNLKDVEVLGAALGSGADGVVHKVKYKGEIMAAKFFDTEESFESDVRKECEIMNSVASKHVVEFYGFSGEDTEKLGFLMRYCEKGSMKGVLRVCGNKAVAEGDLHFNCRDWDTKLLVLLQTAMGIKALHDQSISIRDLKWDNVLVTEENVVKLCDFGRSKHLKTFMDYVNSSKMKGSPGYMSPEATLGTELESKSKKSDIYSFGIMIFALLVLSNDPYKFYEKLTTQRITNKEKFMVEFQERIAKESIRPNFADFAHNQTDHAEYSWLYELMVKCWDHNPDVRPDIDTVLKALDERAFDPENYGKGVGDEEEKEKEKLNKDGEYDLTNEEELALSRILLFKLNNDFYIQDCVNFEDSELDCPRRVVKKAIDYCKEYDLDMGEMNIVKVTFDKNPTKNEPDLLIK